MLTSIIYKNYLGYDQITKFHSYEYEITDSDLGVHLVEVRVEVEFGVGVAVIKFYEERNLDVASNLVRAFIFYSQKSGYKIEDIISWDLKYNTKYQKYHEEVQKYLMCL